MQSVNAVKLGEEECKNAIFAQGEGALANLTLHLSGLT